MINLPDNSFDPLRKTMEDVAQSVRISAQLADAFATYAKQAQSISESINRNMTPFLSGLNRSTELFKAFDRAGLTPNLGSNRSIRRLKDYQRLLRMGYAIFWVPREETVEALLTATLESERKQIIINNKQTIIDDCSAVLSIIDKKTLLNHKLHLESAINSLQHGEYRAAQSTANVCFDALFDHLVDESTMSRFGEITQTLESTSKTLRKKHKKVDARFLYAALQSQLLLVTLRKFDRLNPNTVARKYGRHSSAHTVSSRQFTEHNSIQAIMTCTSLLATTNKLGRNWVTNLRNLI